MIETNKTETNKKPIITFGILTDVQYANIPDEKRLGKTRYYRQSLDKIKNAVKSWQNYEKDNNQKISFILQLGDLIDGKSKDDSYNAMNTVLNELNQYFSAEELANSDKTPKILHSWGNHEMYNFKRTDLIKTPLYTRRDLNQAVPNVNANYYTFNITDDLVLINLDFYELSVIGYEPDNEYYLEALKFIESQNKNKNLNDGTDLPDDRLHHVAYNGGLHKIQIEWLRKQLELCKTNKKKAIICGHMPINSKASHQRNMPFNYEEIQELIWSFENTCVAYFAGHYHGGGVTRDEHNILHITFPGIIEIPPGQNSFATLEVFKNKIRIEMVTDKVHIHEIKL